MNAIKVRFTHNGDTWFVRPSEVWIEGLRAFARFSNYVAQMDLSRPELGWLVSPN